MNVSECEGLSSATGRQQSAKQRGLAALRQIVASGALRIGVPVQCGGDGGSIDELTSAAIDFGQPGDPRGCVFWSQRLAIEALVQSPNVGLREYLLPMLLSGDLAGATPFPLVCTPLASIEEGNALRLYGQLPCVPNLQWSGFVLLAPILLADGRSEWVTLGGAEAGLSSGIDLADPWPAGSRVASITARGVHLRMDEWLFDASLPKTLEPLADQLKFLVPAM